MASEAYEETVEAWRRGRYERLTAADGWLTLIGKYPIEKGASRIAVEREGQSPLDLGMTFDGTRATVEVAPGDVRELTAAGISLGSLKLELLLRGDEAYLRVKDAAAPARTGFTGVPHFPVDSRWRVVARLEPFAEPREVTLDYEGGASTTYRAAGVAVFDVDGKEQRLTLLHDTDRPRLYVLFKDATSRESTYGAGRFLYAELPVDGTVVLDFNQAFNPPCALTPWASCPLVPRENWLPVHVHAGEKRPEDH
jgi:uncharacterized protein